ncbi:MAG: TonB-dependent receptor [Sphingobium sp.]|nr:TonB-dependent receptor [Sphingobium sp.]
MKIRDKARRIAIGRQKSPLPPAGKGWVRGFLRPRGEHRNRPKPLTPALSRKREREIGRAIHSGRVLALALALLAAASSAPAQAQEPDDKVIIVTATGLPQDRDESGQAIAVIDGKAIDQRQTQTVADLLATTPSVRVNSNGSLGSVTSVSLRGAEVGQTLVLLDGVRINDPSGTSGAVDFGNLMIANIRRIEVMRGSNAIPYGSDAMGGVVNLSTREEGAPDGLALRANAEGGYAGTASGAVDLGWRKGDLRIDGGIAGFRTDGISSADIRFGVNERDTLTNITGHVRIEMPVSDAVVLDLRTYAVDAHLAYDSFFGPPADSSDESDFKQVTGYAGLTAKAFDGRLESRLSVTLLGNRRDYRFMPGTPPDFGYRGNRWRAEYEGALTVNSATRLVLGLSHDAPDYRFFGFGSDERHKADTDSAYAMAILKPLPRLTLTGGVRHDDHSQFGGVTTFGANANWGLGDGHTRLRFAYGEGFRAPSLYQLYDTYSGNRALLPERSHSFDLGIDRTLLGGKGRLALTLFARTTRNQIDYDLTTFAYANLARTLARGLEASLDVEPVKDLTIALAYSLIDTRNRTSGSAAYDQHLFRRPVNSVSLSIDRRWPIGLSTGLTVRHVDSALDPTAPSGMIGSYELLGLRAALPIGKSLELYARLDNALDAHYETSYGYGSYGRSGYGGLRVRL